MDDPFFTVAEVAALLKLNQQTVRNMVDRGELRAVRVGQRRVRIRRSELDRFLAGADASPSESADEKAERDGGTERRVEELFAEVGGRLTEARDALVERNHDELVEALRSLAGAANNLAAALSEHEACLRTVSSSGR
jgi:excisionase family DNA binding protein